MNDFYPRPPRGGRPVKIAGVWLIDSISTHALREEGDGVRCRRSRTISNFYPRPPRGGRRIDGRIGFALIIAFLPTPSARRATLIVSDELVLIGISTHALREEGDDDLPGLYSRMGISTHALREEGDQVTVLCSLAGLISTHALREEGDVMGLGLPPCTFLDFYPRPPRGGRQ